MTIGPGAGVTGADTGTGELGAVAARRSGPLAVGQAFGPRYHIIKLLGVGGMGAVYQTWDAELGVAVALKVIVTGQRGPASAEAEKRFKTELLLARQVTHKHVVRIHDLGEIDGIKYITMPYVQGDDLGTLLRREGKLPIPRAMRFARQIAGGLQAAHEAGVVHRDLKPPNIMIGGAGDDEQALIMDFGISASTDENTAGTIVGTLEYMSPEQGTGKAVDGRSDLYAFGLILYEMLTGPRPPLASGPDRFAAMRLRFENGLPPLREVDATIPQPLAQLVMRCLDGDPAMRYQSAAEVSAALAALDDAGELIPIPARFGPRLVAASAVAVLALVAGTWWLARTPPSPKQHDPVSVLIADVDNQSGDPTLEGAVEQTLTTALEGASFINAYRSDTAHRIAGQVRPGSKTMDEGLARLVAIREGVNVVVSGAVVPKGTGYRVSARAIDAATGKEIAQREMDVPNRDALLPAVGKLTPSIRKALGDSTRESEQLAAAVTFTAASLDAAHEYSIGQQFKERDPQQAIEHYRNALQLDPKLGMAYFGMAVASVNLKRTDDAANYYRAAMNLLDHMSEREKQRMLGTYYASFVRNYDQAIETFKRLVTLYPSDVIAYNNLSVTYALKADFPDAVTAIRRAIDLSPKNVRFRLNYVIYSMYAGDFATAIAEAQRMIKDDPGYRYPYLPLALSTLLRGDVNGARNTYQQLEALNASTATIGEADLELYLGHNHAALTILQQAAPADERDKNAGEAALKYIAASEAYLALGQKANALTAARQATTLGPDESVQFPAARALLAAGDEAAAEHIAAKLENTLQTQSRSYAQLIRAEIALRHNRYADAIDAARAAQKQHDSWISHFLLGRAYLEAGHFAEALANFDTCMKRQGEAADLMFADSATARYLPQLYFWMAKAQAGVGSTSSAAENYRKFIALRADADAADPLVAAARRALAQ
jgi:tetratricopeptide (TPR) repeat protein